jgi:hypothetical protein
MKSAGSFNVIPWSLVDSCQYFEKTLSLKMEVILPKRLCLSMKLHCVTSQKTVILIQTYDVNIEVVAEVLEHGILECDAVKFGRRCVIWMTINFIRGCLLHGDRCICQCYNFLHFQNFDNFGFSTPNTKMYVLVLVHNAQQRFWLQSTILGGFHAM